MNGCVVATVGGREVPVADVDAREFCLRAGPLAAALPQPGTSKGRQLRRWLTQLLVSELVIELEAQQLGLGEGDVPTEAELLPDTAARLEVGSVAAAALRQTPARALFTHLTREITGQRPRHCRVPRAQPAALCPTLEHPIWLAHSAY